MEEELQTTDTKTEGSEGMKTGEKDLSETKEIKRGYSNGGDLSSKLKTLRWVSKGVGPYCYSFQFFKRKPEPY